MRLRHPCLRSALLGCVLGLAALSSARADSYSILPGYDPEVSVRVGTLGIGPEIGIRIPGSPFGVRANFNAFTYNDDSIYSHRFDGDGRFYSYDVDARFRGSVRLLNGGLTGDWYPLRSHTGLRLSAGLYVNGDRITGMGDANGSVTVGRTTYEGSNAGTVSATALTDDVAPYIGFGWSGRIYNHFIFSADAGILIEGDPRVSAVSGGEISNIPAFNTQLQVQRAKVANDVDVPVYPVVSLGIGYQF